MRFSVLVGSKKFAVSLMKEPNNVSALSQFHFDGKSYIGLQDQYNGIKYDKNKDKYSAISIKVNVENNIVKNLGTIKVLENKKKKQEEQPLEDEQIYESIPTKEELKKNEEEKKEELFRELNRQTHIIQRQEKSEESKKLEFKKIQFHSRISSIFPDSTSYGEGLFEKHRNVWIRLHGSEHLKTALDMQCRCDSLYIQERHMLEFKDWELHSLFTYYEIDSPNFGILTFLKNFKNIHKDILNNYRSRVVLGTTDNDDNEDDPYVIVTDYLGHCDLSIKLTKLVELYGDRC